MKDSWFENFSEEHLKNMEKTNVATIKSKQGTKLATIHASDMETLKKVVLLMWDRGIPLDITIDGDLQMYEVTGDTQQLTIEARSINEAISRFYELTGDSFNTVKIL